MRLLPNKPIHGFSFSQLLLNALIDADYLTVTRLGYTVIDDRLFYLDNDELEEILQIYLAKKDQ